MFNAHLPNVDNADKPIICQKNKAISHWKFNVLSFNLQKETDGIAVFDHSYGAM